MTPRGDSDDQKSERFLMGSFQMSNDNGQGRNTGIGHN